MKIASGCAVRVTTGRRAVRRCLCEASGLRARPGVRCCADRVNQPRRLRLVVLRQPKGPGRSIEVVRRPVLLCVRFGPCRPPVVTDHERRLMFSRTPGRIWKLLRNVSGICASSVRSTRIPKRPGHARGTGAGPFVPTPRGSRCRWTAGAVAALTACRPAGSGPRRALARGAATSHPVAS